MERNISAMITFTIVKLFKDITFAGISCTNDTKFDHFVPPVNKVKDSTGRETNITTDSEGNIIQVTYPDGKKRNFSYNNRGLMTTDKRGVFEKTYVWDSKYPVLTKILLPNGGERIVEASALKFIINDMER